MLGPRTIYAKGLILISVPLLLEWAFGITMFTLQHYYREKINQERTASEIIFHANVMWTNCSEVLMLKSYFDLFGGPAPIIEERMSRLNAEYSLLKNLLAHDPEQAKILEEIRSRTLRALVLTNRFSPLESTKPTAAGRISALASNFDTFQMAYNLVDPIATAIREFRKPEFFHSPAAAEEVEKASFLVDLIVLGSLAGSALAAILLFIYFIRSINRGVVSMVENTERFKQGEELKPPLAGTDELAKLD